jgi:hypothetical protein
VWCALRACAEALAGLPRMLRKRRQIRRAMWRNMSDREFMDLLERFRIPLAELVFQSQQR